MKDINCKHIKTNEKMKKILMLFLSVIVAFSAKGAEYVEYYDYYDDQGIQYELSYAPESQTAKAKVVSVNSNYAKKIVIPETINYNNFGNIRELLFEIESCLDDYFDDELDMVSQQLSEYIYYNETKK